MHNDESKVTRGYQKMNERHFGSKLPIFKRSKIFYKPVSERFESMKTSLFPAWLAKTNIEPSGISDEKYVSIYAECVLSKPNLSSHQHPRHIGKRIEETVAKSGEITS